MRTEDDVARDLRKGIITPDQALAEMQTGEVLVYAAVGHDPATATWADVEDQAVGSADLFAAFRLAGADDTFLGLVGDQVGELRKQGVTIESRFGPTWYGEGTPR